MSCWIEEKILTDGSKVYNVAVDLRGAFECDSEDNAIDLMMGIEQLGEMCGVLTATDEVNDNDYVSTPEHDRAVLERTMKALAK